MAFAVSDGQLAAVDKAPGMAPFPTVRLSEGLVQSYAAIWRSQPQIRTVTSFLARNVAQIGLHCFRRVDDVDRERLTDHPLPGLLNRPTPWTTRYRQIDALMLDLGIYDRAFWVKLKPRGQEQPMALQRVAPTKVTLLGDNPFVPDGFRIRGAKGNRDLPADQVVFFRGYNPDDARDGCSPIETLRRVLAEEYAAGQHREQLWRNGARHSGYIRRPVDAPKWSDTAKSRFKREWKSQYTGDGPEAGGTPILEDGMEFASAAVTPEQAQYLEARKLTREEVAAAYHIPPPMIGILDHATFSNVREQHKQLYQDTLGPWLQMIAEEIQLQLLPEFADNDRVYIEFNLSAKLAGSFEEEAARLQTATGAPWMTRNEARARQNLPQIDGGDELVTPLNVLTGGQASPTDSAPDDNGKARGVQVKAAAPASAVDAGERLFASYFERQGKAIASALGALVTDTGKARRAGRTKAAPALDEFWDDDRWDGELAAELYRHNLTTATAAARATLEAADRDPDLYDPARTHAWAAANAMGAAGSVNGATKRRLAELLDEGGTELLAAVSALFADYAKTRARETAQTRVTDLSGFGAQEAARQTGGGSSTKTWRVTSTAPRPSHVAMNGETVGLDDRFSNGAKWPGDSVLSVDELAGCECVLLITFGDD